MVSALLLVGILAIFWFWFRPVLLSQNPIIPSATPTAASVVSPANGVLLVTGEWEPFTTEKTPDQGFFTQIVEAVFKEMGVKTTIKFYPWARCELLVQNGDAFAAFPYTPSGDRAKKYLFSKDIYKVASKLFFYNKTKAAFTYRQLSDLKSYKIGGVSGYFYLEWFKKADIAYDLSDTEDAALQKLIDGKVELVPLTEANAWNLINQKYPKLASKFGTIDQPLDENKISLLVSKSYPHAQQLLDQFNVAFDRIISRGIYSEILHDSDKTEGSILN
jgi:polar amino acid transport system substrate-binding protein